MSVESDDPNRPSIAPVVSIDDARQKRRLREATEIEAAYDALVADELFQNDRGKPRNNLANAVTTLRFDRAWWEVLAFDTFQQRVTTDRALPFARPDGPWTDSDYDRARLWFSHQRQVDLSKTDIRAAVDLVARDRPLHSVARYLDRLQWDGVERLDEFLIRYFGARDSQWNSLVGPLWAVSAVARAKEPGCQVDTMIVLEDPQGGQRKSSGLRTLAGSNWFTDHISDFESDPRDVANQLDGVWIVEFPEMGAFRRCKDVDSKKEFLSRREERHVHKWEKEARCVPRSCVFVGTCQTNLYLHGGDGGEARRFHPVEIERPVDTDAIARDRDQIWAEATAHYAAGRPWWLDDAVAAEGREYTAGRSDDAFVGRLRELLDTECLAEGVRLDVVMKKLFGKSVRGWGSDREEKRVVKCLRMLGWTRRKLVLDGGRREWRYCHKSMISD